MDKLTLAEITSFTWRLNLSQLNWFTGNLFVTAEYKTFLSMLDGSFVIIMSNIETFLKKILSLGILTGKAHLQIKLKRLREV